MILRDPEVVKVTLVLRPLGVSRSQVSGSGLNPTAPSFGPTTTIYTCSNQKVLLHMAKVACGQP